MHKHTIKPFNNTTKQRNSHHDPIIAGPMLLVRCVEKLLAWKIGRSQESPKSDQERTKTEHKLLFLKLFGHPRDIPAKTPGYPAKKFGFHGFRRTYRTFWPPPLHVEDPHPTRRYLDQKFWAWVPFAPKTKEDQGKGRRHPNRENPAFETPPLYRPLTSNRNN